MQSDLKQIPGHEDYIKLEPVLSPWSVVPGWHLGTAFHDPMHVLYLGTCRDLLASAMGYWIRNKFYDADGSLSEMLRTFSNDLKEQSRQQKTPSSDSKFSFL